MSTCYGPYEIPSVLDEARRAAVWRTETQHRYCLALFRIDAQSHKAFRFPDGRIDCETCGPKRRREAVKQSARQFKSSATLYLTLVRPTQKARHAGTKQIGDRNGTGWYIPIWNAFALISNVPIRSKTGDPYSIEIPAAETDETCTDLLDMWLPENGRMTRPGYRKVDSDIPASQEKHSDQPKELRVALGTTNTRYEQNLEKVSIPFISQGDTMTIATRWSDANHEEALKNSNWRPPENDIDWEPPQELRDIENEEEKRSG